MTDTSNMADRIDVRDVIEQYEELEDLDERDEYQDSDLNRLRRLLEELRDNGGDEQWRGYWYPVTLVRDSDWRDYAEELADDIGAINHEAGWPNNHINWDAAAAELQQDYTSVEYDGITYWYR